MSDQVISPDAPPDPKDGFSLLVDGASEYAVFALSPAGVVCTWNRGAQRIKGYRPDEVVGRHFSMFFPEEDRAAGVPAKLLECALAEGKVTTEGWRVRKDGGRFWASVVISALYDDIGRIRGFGKLVRDDTERRQRHAYAVRHAEQERIAVSLADTVVRRLFSVSLRANTAMDLASPALRPQLELLIDEIDETIRLVRNTVFDTRAPPRPGSRA
ncbi:MAG TPA: PAS domain S-box protein [Acidimicrobiales bacterium]|nr:PAS domain S-box protein [Acidimicrobiales bacterium]